ncbi:hypothetical protein [Spartinivicinus poritis]|uniref:Lipoprotein n=1 Tax=Spartinivicinus poritis TaxID=2994640 RepID=A0ABT5U4T6_9GAMM|nr:hypothetical protein [Spartinivicinus sp. A2-2]MDE1461374.1 hypothetical protein [Spartinivicinus sp. A2-2]
MKRYYKPAVALLLACIFTLTSCSNQPFQIENLAKTDTDLVADSVRQNMNKLLKRLLIKLYKRNPAELAKNPNQTIKTRTEQLFNNASLKRYPELSGKQAIDAMLLAFDDHFHGDRVFALMAGLTDMIKQSYNYRNEFFVLDELDQQKLYNSARNMEVLAWRLNNRLNAQGKPYLLTNATKTQSLNLSFERLFGKMIALQDMMAMIIADKTNRTINFIVRGVATGTFIPI